MKLLYRSITRSALISLSYVTFAVVSLQLSVSPLDELLAAVDVEGRAGDRRVRHEVDGQCGDVGRADDASDRQRRAELFAARVQPVAEDRRRQRRVDEPGRDQVHADGRELEREVLRDGGKRGRESRDEREPRRRAAATGAAHEE